MLRSVGHKFPKGQVIKTQSADENINGVKLLIVTARQRNFVHQLRQDTVGVQVRDAGKGSFGFDINKEVNKSYF